MSHGAAQRDGLCCAGRLQGCSACLEVQELDPEQVQGSAKSGLESRSWSCELAQAAVTTGWAGDLAGLAPWQHPEQ